MPRKGLASPYLSAPIWYVCTSNSSISITIFIVIREGKTKDSSDKHDNCFDTATNFGCGKIILLYFEMKQMH